MSAEYRQILRSEVGGIASKWFGVIELLVTLGGYGSAIYLWYAKAPAWRVAAALAVAIALTFVLQHLSGKAAWQKERAAKELAEATLAEERNSSPCLRLREPGAVHIEPITFTDWSNGQAVWQADFLKVRVVNDPQRPSPTAEAKGVTAKVTISRNGRTVREVDGRWSESEQPHRRIRNLQSITDLLHMDIGIGDERSVDLVFKAVADRDAYIFNNDSYLCPPDMKKPDHRLEPGDYEVRVRLRAPRVDEVFKFRFINPGAGEAMRISKDGRRFEITK